MKSALLHKWRESSFYTTQSTATNERKERALILFLTWCKQQRIHPLSITLDGIVTYLRHLQEKGTAYSTLRGARRAIIELLMLQKNGLVLDTYRIRLPKRESYRAVIEKKTIPRVSSREETTVLRAFADELQLRGIRTGRWYVQNAKAFFDWCASRELPITAVRQSDIEEYQHELLTRVPPLHRGSINNKLNGIKQCYLFMIKRTIMGSDPFEGFYGVKTGHTLPRVIASVDDMKQVLFGAPCAKPLDILVTSVIYVLYGCAVRISEVLTLRLSDWDNSGGYISIREWKNNGKVRRVPIPEMAARYLHRYITTARPLLLGDSKEELVYVYQGTGVNAALINRHIQKRAEQAGLRPITSHCFRHSAATHVLRNGAGIREVQALLGHESIMSTAVYTRIVKEDLKKLITRYHPRELQKDTHE